MPRHSRTSLVFALTLLARFAAGDAAASAADGYLLQADPQPNDLRRVQIIAESEGVIRVKAPKVGANAAENAKEAQTTKNDTLRDLPLRARGELRYDERSLSIEGPRQRRSLRYYREATAKVHLSGGDLTPSLDEAHRWILADCNEGASTLVSTAGPMSREQLELTRPPLNSAAADLILPGREVALGESWKLESPSIAAVMDVDLITQADVSASLKRVEKDLAIIEFSGKFSASLKGVASDYELVGKANFHLPSRAVTWLAVSFDEERAIGHGQPGVKARTRVRMQMQPLEEAPELADTAIAEMPLDYDDAQQLLRFESQPGAFRVLLERNWNVMLERQDVVIMRYVDQGDFIAQVNVSPLENVEAGRQVKLEAFQAEVVKALKDYNAALVDAREYASSTGLQILRVAAAGLISDVNVNWIYYHATSQDGRRASFVFTIQDKMMDRFAGADETFTASFELTPRAPQVSSNPDASEAPAQR